MKKKNGFTLVELLAVIVILGVLAGIAVISYNVYIDHATKSYYTTAEKTSKASAESLFTYCTTTVFDEEYCSGVHIPTDDESLKIPISTLVDNEFMTPVVSQKTGDPCTGDVIITNDGDVGVNNKLSYQVCLMCGDYNSPICDERDSSFFIEYVLRQGGASGSPYKSGSWTSKSIYQKFTTNSYYKVPLKNYQIKLVGDSTYKDISGDTYTVNAPYNGKVFVRAVDMEGNYSSEISYTIKIDTTSISMSGSTSKTYVLGSSAYQNAKITDLFTFGSFGPSGGTITCTSGGKTLYENNNGTIKDNGITQLGSGTHQISCTATTGAKTTTNATTEVVIKAEDNPIDISVIGSGKYTFVNDSAEHKNTKASSLFTFGNFGASGGTIKCQSGSTVFYENNGGTIVKDDTIYALKEGTHKMTCTATTGTNNTSSAEAEITIIAEDKDFAYSGTEEDYPILVSGTYRIKASGAQGQNGAKGGSIQSTIYLDAGTILKVNIGGQNGYNGGGTGSSRGGGATTVKLNNVIIISAAGGGGGSGATVGGSGTGAGGANDGSGGGGSGTVTGAGGGASYSHKYCAEEIPPKKECDRCGINCRWGDCEMLPCTGAVCGSNGERKCNDGTCAGWYQGNCKTYTCDRYEDCNCVTTPGSCGRYDYKINPGQGGSNYFGTNVIEKLSYNGTQSGNGTLIIEYVSK